MEMLKLELTYESTAEVIQTRRGGSQPSRDGSPFSEGDKSRALTPHESAHLDSCIRQFQRGGRRVAATLTSLVQVTDVPPGEYSQM